MNPLLTQAQSREQAHTDANPEHHSVVSARLHGGWLIFARISWLVLTAFALTVFVADLPLYFADIQLLCNGSSCDVGQLRIESAQILQNVGISVGSYVLFTFILTIVLAMVWFVVGGLIFWRKSDERVALLVSFALVMYGSQAGDSYLLTVNNPAWTIPVTFVQVLAWMALFLVLFLFPDGHFVPRWMRWFAVGFFLLVVDASLSNIFPSWVLNPWNVPFSPFSFALIVIYGIGLTISQVYRYRRISSLVQRRQTKLVFFALCIFLLGAVVFDLVIGTLIPSIFPALTPPDPLTQVFAILNQSILPLLIPVSFGIAMFRYRLWDIDIIIKRTLVYSTLTGTLVVVYAGSILVLQALLSGFTGGNTVALVGSTLAIAALFQPFRRRIQGIIDRRFFRRKYDAAHTIAAFSATLRGEVDLNALSEQLVAVVQETMQPTFVSLWLQHHDREAQKPGWLVSMTEQVPFQQSHSFPSETEVIETPEEVPTLPPARAISRRAVLLWLGVGGVVVASGGLSWWLLKRRPIFTYRGHSNATYDVAWSPNGKRITSTSKDATVQIWNATDGSHVLVYRGHKDEVNTAGWSPDGKRIASCSKDTTVQVWNAANGGHLFTYRGHKDAVIVVVWSPDGTRLASGGGVYMEDGKPHDNTVQVWDASDGGHVFTYHGHARSVLGVVWSPDGTRIASASNDKTVQVWDAVDGGHVFTYRGHTDQVLTLSWSPDGKYLASGSADKTVQIWDAVDGGHVFTYTGHTDWVTGVAWSPDSRRIVSASSDKTAQVWDALDGGHVFVYDGHTNFVITAAWSPDGTRIATTSFDGTVQIWSPT